MTDGDRLRSALTRTAAIGIIRGCPREFVVDVGAAAFEAGIGALEITLDSPDPIGGIQDLVDALPDAAIGAGTVRTVAEMEASIAGGASFIVSPILSSSMIEAASSHGVPVLPGAATPTEIWAAVEAGAFAVKVFPARELGGPGYLSAVLGPLGQPALVPTGGVGIDDAASYLAVGAFAVGVGGSVFPASALAEGDSARVGSLAVELVRSLA